MAAFELPVVSLVTSLAQGGRPLWYTHPARENVPTTAGTRHIQNILFLLRGGKSDPM
jgi:hypothetical protein